MQEHDGWGVLRACFPVENPDAVDLHAMIGRRSVGRRQCSGFAAPVEGRWQERKLICVSLLYSFYKEVSLRQSFREREEYPNACHILK